MSSGALEALEDLLACLPLLDRTSQFVSWILAVRGKSTMDSRPVGNSTGVLRAAMTGDRSRAPVSIDEAWIQKFGTRRQRAPIEATTTRESTLNNRQPGWHASTLARAQFWSRKNSIGREDCMATSLMQERLPAAERHGGNLLLALGCTCKAWARSTGMGKLCDLNSSRAEIGLAS